MGKSAKPRKKYSDNHSASSTLWKMSTPMIQSMIHKPEGRAKLNSMIEAELKAHPERTAELANLQRNLAKYDDLQGVQVQ